MTGEKPRIELSAVQVVGGALAAASAAVAASLLGVAGTVIGAAVASIVTTVGSAMYTHSMRRGRYELQQRTAHLTHLHRLPVRKVQPAENADPAEPAENPDRARPVENAEAAQPAEAEAAEADAAGRGETAEPGDETTAPENEGDGPDDAAPRHGWRDRFRSLDARTVAITAGCVLVLALGVITGVEALLGKPISAALDGGAQRGTSIGSLADGGHAPATTPTRTPHPTGTATATPTGSATVTRSPNPTPTSTAPSRPAAQTPTTSAPAATPTQTSGTSGATPPPTTSPRLSTHDLPGGQVP